MIKMKTTKMTIRKIKSFFILLAISFSFISCGDDSCLELAKKICSCYEESDERRACSRRMNNRSFFERDAVDNQNSYCEQKLSTCSCEAARSGSESCGFTGLPSLSIENL